MEGLKRQAHRAQITEKPPDFITAAPTAAIFVNASSSFKVLFFIFFPRFSGRFVLLDNAMQSNKTDINVNLISLTGCMC